MKKNIIVQAILRQTELNNRRSDKYLKRIVKKVVKQHLGDIFAGLSSLFIYTPPLPLA